MNWSTGILIIGVVLLTLTKILEIYIKSKSTQKVDNTKNYKYTKKYYFFTLNELSFYKALIPIANELNLIVFAKTRLADIIEPQKGSSNWSAAFTKIKSKHLDFILCSNEPIKPLLAIELDDSSHDTEKRKERDNFVDEALKMANLPIIHTRNAKNLKESIKEKLEWQPETL